jgi:ribonuclease G
MQAAFVDIGLERAAFLHASDIVIPHLETSEETNRKIELPINELVHEGQTLLVQVIKDPIGTKGARLTTLISIPSRYVVLIPYSPNTVGISTRIEKDEERRRLREIVLDYLGMSGFMMVQSDDSTSLPLSQSTSSLETETLVAPVSRRETHVNCHHGYIIRTAAEGVDAHMLQVDMDFLCRLWKDIQERVTTVPACSLIYEDFPLVSRTIRDLMGTAIEKVRIDSYEAFEEVKKFASKFIPDLTPHVYYYAGEHPIFDLYNIEDEINKALERKVQLKSGGYLVIDQTEAMTTIDVNTGAFVGTRNLEETIFKTNLEAAQAIARQLRLRNLGGIIILDFIDMIDLEHRRQVLRTLEKCLEKDHAKSHISEVSSLGLVQMTRKRTRESLGHILCEVCPVCGGRGSIKTPETVCYEIFRGILRDARQFEGQHFLVLAAQEVVDRLVDEESLTIAELEKQIGRSIKFQVETSYTQEQYDIVLSPS